MTAWLTCSPSRCVTGSRIAYCDCAAVQSAAAILPDRQPKCRQLFPSGRCRWRPHAGVLNRARKGPVFFYLLIRAPALFVAPRVIGVSPSRTIIGRSGSVLSSAALAICHLRGFPVLLAHAVDSGVEVGGSAGIQ